MNDETKSDVVLITGAMSDIGQAIARSFAGSGYTVVINYRKNSELAESFAESLIRDIDSPRAIAIKADIRLRTEVQSLFNSIYQYFGKLDVLVNNAGINRDRSFLEMTDDEWDTVVSTVLKGSFICSQEFARHYKGNNGNIINIGAVTALKGRKNGANYCSARAGVLALTKCMALELAPNIRVNVVTPGRINTEELRSRYGADKMHDSSDFNKDIPLAQLGKPTDIANMINFIVRSGQYITGQNFLVDGGLFMR